MIPKFKIGLVVVATLGVANLVVYHSRLESLWKSTVDQSKLDADQKRMQECLQDLAERFDAKQLVGTPTTEIADCLRFIARKKELENGRTSYTFQHPKAKNQEGPADIGIIIDSKSGTVVRAELLYYDW